MVQRSVAAIDLRLFWCRGSGQSGCRRRRRPQSVGAGARLPTDATLGDRGATQPVRACLCAGDPAVAPGISARLVTACVVRKIDACDLHRITAADRESVARERATRPPDPSGIEGLPARTESLLPCRAALHPALGTRTSSGSRKRAWVWRESLSDVRHGPRKHPGCARW